MAGIDVQLRSAWATTRRRSGETQLSTLPASCTMGRVTIERGGFEKLDDTLRGWEADRDLSGTVLLTRHGETLFEGCYGLADRAAAVPVSPRTRFALASLTKMFTAVAVADLVAHGHLRFDRRVVEVLPAERRPSTLLPEVTVHHLLSHTSGIADYYEEDERSPAYLADFGSLWDDRPSYAMLRPGDFLPLFGDLPPNRAPGGPFQYSNAGYVLLGLLIEQVTGRPYTEVVQERVFDRSAMAASGFFRLDDVVPDVAVGYLPRKDAVAPWRSNIYRVPVIGGADGGAFSTARDLDRFLGAYGDGTLLGPVHDVVLSRQAVVAPGFHAGYGVFFHPDGRYGHEGGDPGVEVHAVRWPDEHAHLVVLCNMVGLADEVCDLLVAARNG